MRADPRRPARLSQPDAGRDPVRKTLTPSRPTTLRRITSGGQTGVDRAALRAAGAAGLEIGGWCPPGRASESGPIPDDLPLRETPEDRSALAPEVPRSQRTEWNVRDADATLVLGPADATDDDPGTAFTLACAEHYARPLLRCDPADPGAGDRILDWLEARAVVTLNVAGPSERNCPGIDAACFALLRAVFDRVT